MVNVQRAPSLRDHNDVIRPGRTAIILNKNAKRVGERVRRRVVAAAPDADVFFTESLEQADFVIRRILDSGYGTVVTGGGDGTVTDTIDRVVRYADAAGRARPRFAVLKLGTGNAVASFLGAGHVTRDLQCLSTAADRPLDLLRVGDRRATFGGFGWDAYILDNYERMKAAADRFAVTRALFKSAAGYLIAGIGKSVPELVVKRPRYRVRVINTGGIGLKLDHEGRVVERVAPGAVAFDGYSRLACFGTTPYFGFKLKIMPFADKTPGMFHLRMIDMHPLSAVWNLRRTWQGNLRHPKVTDFQLSACRFEFEQPAPLQLAGDAAGCHRSLDVAIDRPIECVWFPS